MGESGTVTAKTDSGPLGSEKQIHVNAENVALTSFRRGEPTGFGLVLLFGVPALGWYMIDSTIGTGADVVAVVLFFAVLSLVVDLGETRVLTNTESFDFEGDEEQLEALERELERETTAISVSRSRSWPHKELTYRIHLNQRQVSSVTEADKLTLATLAINGGLGLGLLIDWTYVLLSAVDGDLVSAALGAVVGILGLAILVVFNVVVPTPRRVEVTLTNGESHFFDLHPKDADRLVTQFTSRR